MKEKVTHNFGLKLLSVGLAALLWLVVINSQDPVETVYFEDIPVTIINEEALVAKDKIPEVVEGDTISVAVEARRSVCDKLTKADIVAVADFEKISVTDAVPIDVSVKNYSKRDVEVVRGLNQVMKLRLEDSITKDFRVKISTTGQPKEGYVIGDMVASPNMISLTGSSTQISKIKEVVLMVDVDNVSEESKTKGIPVIYDMNGEAVNSSKVSMSTDEVAVTIPVLKTKIISIVVTTQGEPATGFEVGEISYQPQMVTVAGTVSDLHLLGSTLNAKCDITGQNGVVEENIDISSLWMESLDSLRLVDEDKLAVTITMQPYEEKIFGLSEDAIELRGLQKGFRAEIGFLYETKVHISGKAASIKELTLQKLAPYIDLSEITTTGSYTLPICIDNLENLILHDVLTAVVDVNIDIVPEPTVTPEPEQGDTMSSGQEETAADLPTGQAAGQETE